jgi:uncharacterized LabA/DUF88 family protein
MLQVAIVIDYQNIHLTAHGCWAPDGLPVHESLIHPLRFAEQVMQVRSHRQRDDRQKHAVLADVYVFRGLPSNRHQPAFYRVNQAQKSEWERDPRVHVTYRPLRYSDKWPDQPAQEKGIDVPVALNLVRIAERATHDVVILAAHDTDLEPALDMAALAARTKVETAGWEGCRRLRVPGRSLWHTALSGTEFLESRDRKDYAAYFNAAP